jgi:hypothetical protein
MNEQELVTLNQAASSHRALLAASKVCGCFRCLSFFGNYEIRKWIQQDTTALCPRCNEDAVIGDASCPRLTRQLLEEMHKRWFER